MLGYMLHVVHSLPSLCIDLPVYAPSQDRKEEKTFSVRLRTYIIHMIYMYVQYVQYVCTYCFSSDVTVHGVTRISSLSYFTLHG